MSVKIDDYCVSLDSREQDSNLCFVSHAHLDHMSGIRSKKPILATPETAKLIEARTGKAVALAERPKNFKLPRAGHVLGSAQMYARSERDGFSVLYSGDYQMHEPVIGGGIETVNADVLVIDSTYPHPDLVFDDKTEVADAIKSYCSAKLDRGIVIFGAYALGKAQELIRILNEAGISPVVGPKISRINAVYKEFGHRLDYVSLCENEGEFDSVTRSNFVGIVENRHLDAMRYGLSSIYGRRVYTAVATGFAKMMRFNTDVQFPLSDHADFKQATEYIDACAPRVVVTCGKGADVFAKNLRSAGYNAHPASGDINRSLIALAD